MLQEVREELGTKNPLLFGNHEGPYGVDPASPLKAAKDGPRSGKGKIGSKRIFDELEGPLRDQSRKRRRLEPVPVIEPKTPSYSPSLLIDLERKWHAVLEFRELRAQGLSTNELTEAIGEKYGIGSGRNVRILAEKVEKRGTLLRKPGSGAPKTVSNRLEIQEFFNQQAMEWEYTFTYEAMALAIKKEFGEGSTKTVKAIMDHLEYRARRRVVRPFLTPDHRLARLNWAIQWNSFDFFDKDVVVLHLDEKCFYAFDARGKVVYLPPGVDPEPLYALSKTQIPWVMFLGVVGAPRPEHRFDGKVGLFHVGEPKVAERRSKYHEKGDEYWVNVNMDGDVFIQMVRDKVIPAIRENCKFAKKVIVQIDSAGGHRISESLPELNKIGKKQGLKIEFVTQPCRSPDTNVLDLGLWNSMKSHVVEQKYMRNSNLSMNQRIINAVMEMWAEYDSEIITSIFHTLKAVLREIVSCKGGNSFKQPRKIKK